MSLRRSRCLPLPITAKGTRYAITSWSPGRPIIILSTSVVLRPFTSSYLVGTSISLCVCMCVRVRVGAGRAACPACAAPNLLYPKMVRNAKLCIFRCYGTRSCAASSRKNLNTQTKTSCFNNNQKTRLNHQNIWQWTLGCASQVTFSILSRRQKRTP